MANLLDEELETYERLRSELLAEAEDRFVLIHGHELAGAFETEGDAVTIGYQTYGNVPFLVKQVKRIERPVTLISQVFVSH